MFVYFYILRLQLFIFIVLVMIIQLKTNKISNLGWPLKAIYYVDMLIGFVLQFWEKAKQSN